MGPLLGWTAARGRIEWPAVALFAILFVWQFPHFDAIAWARELSQGSPTALALAKSILDRTFETPEEQVFALGREAQAICYTTSEHQDAVQAFLNKTAR